MIRGIVQLAWSTIERVSFEGPNSVSVAANDGVVRLGSRASNAVNSSMLCM